MTSVFFPPEGGRIVLGYSIAPCEGEKNVTFQKSDDEWFSISVTPNSLILTATAGSSREGYVTPLFNGVACTNIIVSQGACDCSSFYSGGVSTISFNYIIPESGAEVGTVIGTYLLDGCSDSEIRFDSDLGLIAENGKIKLTTAIPQTTETAFTEYDVDIYYGQSDEKCFSDVIFQEGTVVKCDCSGVEYFVESFKKSYPLSGTSDYVMIASGSTHNCGVLSAITTSEIFEGQDIRCEYNENKSKFEFWGKLLPATINRSGGLRLYYLDSEGVEQDCNVSLVVTQTNQYCYCENPRYYMSFRKNFGEWDYDNAIVFFNSYEDYLNGSEPIGNTLYTSIESFDTHNFFILNYMSSNWMSPIEMLVDGSNRPTNCRVIWPSSSDADWIYPACNPNSSWTDCGFYWKKNETNEPRIAHITFDYYIDFDNNSTIEYEYSEERETQYKILSYSIKGCTKCERQFTFTFLQLPWTSSSPCYTNHQLDKCAEVTLLRDYLQQSQFGHYSTTTFYIPSNPTQLFKQPIDKEYVNPSATVSATTDSGNWAYICFDGDRECLCIENNNSSSPRTANITVQVLDDNNNVCCENTAEYIQHPIITDCNSFNTSIDYYLYCNAEVNSDGYYRKVGANDEDNIGLYFFGDSRNYKMSAVTCDASGTETPSNIVKRIEYEYPSGSQGYYGGYKLKIIFNENIYDTERVQYIKLFYLDNNGTKFLGDDCYKLLKTIQEEPSTPRCWCGSMSFEQEELEPSYPSNYGEIFIGTCEVSQAEPYCNTVVASTTHGEVLTCRVEETQEHKTYKVYATIGRNTMGTTQEVTVDINLVNDAKTCQYYYVDFHILPE